MQQSERIELWPEGAPLARGNALEDRPAITPFLVDSSDPVGVVVVCPGGGYQMRADHEGAPIARWLNGHGIAAVVLDYRVAPYQHPAPLLDAQRAIRYVRSRASEWNLKKDRVGILGFSAGGHLASTVATHEAAEPLASGDEIDSESSRADAAILCYPVISFGVNRHHGSMVNLIGENPPEELRQNLSNETQVTEYTPPTFLWHTAEDGAVPVANSLLFADALAKNEIPFELHVYPYGGHGMGLATGDEAVGTWPDLCARWLKAQEF